MMILNEFGFRGSRQSLLYAQAFALEHLVSVHSTTTDLRWALIQLALRSFSAMWASAQGRIVRMVHPEKTRDGRDLDAADTMVAAGGR